MKKYPIFTAVAVMGLALMHLSADDNSSKKRDSSTIHLLQSMGSKRSGDVAYTLYINECASCHMAYQTEFLPKRSWKKMMKGLENHFGVDATVEPEDQQVLSTFLEENAADVRYAGRTFAKFARSISPESIPLRITEIPKFKREHRKIPNRYIKQKEVKSLSNCMACHKGADKGSYSEHSIFIPNYGRWDD